MTEEPDPEGRDDVIIWDTWWNDKQAQEERRIFNDDGIEELT